MIEDEGPWRADAGFNYYIIIALTRNFIKFLASLLTSKRSGK